jgi:Protein of unknown function (DUF4238)
MKSHTVPQRLLAQFAYRDPRTKSLRLWRYEQGRKPYPKASPASATSFDGHFADPHDDALESGIEKRLAVQIEDPVNQFISQFFDPSFALTDVQREEMTRYVTLLFNRSKASRLSIRHREQIKARALGQFLANEEQLATVAAQWNIDAYFRRLPLNRLFTTDDIVRAVRRLKLFHEPEASEQESYVTGIERFLTYFDESMFHGEWRLVRTTSDNPFILSDAPVVTWDRKDSEGISHGVGVGEPNVEVFLPVSPLTCLHILPRVPRTRTVIAPQVEEINIAQAKFAHRACFANQNKTDIDNMVQRHISTAKLGENAFTLWNMNYDNLVFDILMKMSPREPEPQTA